MSKLSFTAIGTQTSCDERLQRDWTALYSVAGHSLYTKTYPFLVEEWVWLVRLAFCYLTPLKRRWFGDSLIVYVLA